MNTRLQIQRKTTPESSFTPLRSNLLPQGSTEQAESPVLGPILHDMLPKFQAKLTIGEPNDQYEQEADRVAEQVMRMPQPQLQGRVKPVKTHEEDLGKTKSIAGPMTPQASDHTLSVDSEIAASINTVCRGGRPLPKAASDFFEPRFGYDFSQVRVHTDARANKVARALGVHAFTFGDNIVFGTNQYSPRSSKGRHLLAHELTHVVQQGGVSEKQKGGAKRMALGSWHKEKNAIEPKNASPPLIERRTGFKAMFMPLSDTLRRRYPQLDPDAVDAFLALFRIFERWESSDNTIHFWAAPEPALSPPPPLQLENSSTVMGVPAPHIVFNWQGPFHRDGTLDRSTYQGSPNHVFTYNDGYYVRVGLRLIDPLGDSWREPLSGRSPSLRRP